MEGFNKFENIIKGGGITDYPAFVLMNAKIGSIFSIIQAEISMVKFKNLNQNGQELIQQSIEELEKINVFFKVFMF